MTRRFFSLEYLTVLAFLLPLPALALTNNLALTPPMGWNDWNAYGCGISEFIVTNNAGVIAANGMKAAGYQYIDVDDGWASSRNSLGVIQPYSISTRFPDGIPWLVNYVHSMGLKLGIYTDHGTNTCSSCISGATPPKDPGSFGYEYVDALTYGSWQVDYLKEDNCNVPATASAQVDYEKMSDGLMKSRQPILFCLCGGNGTTGGKAYQSWSPVLGNYWRTTGDIGSTFASMISHIDQNSTTAFAAGPGRWNDPDMLEIGNGEFVTNIVGAQTHFSMWCIMAAPLIAGDNVTTISAQSLAILTNSEAIAVDQDLAGEQGVLVGGIKDNAEVWSKPLGYDFATRAVALLNRSTTTPAVITCNWTNLAFQAGTTATVRDLWGHTNIGTFTNSFTATVPPYATMLLKIVGTPIAPPQPGTNYLSDQQPIYAYTGSGTIVPNKSIGGNTITIGGVPYSKGIGVNSYSGVEYNLGGICTRFQAAIGIDDEVGSSGTVIFQVFADGTLIYNSGVITGSSAPQSIDLDVTGVRRLTLGVGSDDDGTGNDHADWANALVITTNAPQIPEMPAGLIANPGNPIALTWNNTLAALTYNVKRATQSGGPYTAITNVPVTSFTDSNIVSGMTYYYVVSALSSISESSNSAEASVTSCDVPLPPANVTASANNSSVIVNWNTSAGATSYNVYRFTPNTPPVLLQSGITTTTFTDSLLGSAVTNYYYVTAENSCNESGWFSFAGAITGPAAPTGLGAIPGNDSVNLSWNATVGASSYDLLRSTTNGGPYAVIASNVAGTSYLDTTVLNGTNYYYVITAVNTGGQSSDSAQASAMPVAPVTAYWTNNISGTPQNWNGNGNWTNVSAFPNTGGELVVINNALAGPQTINLNQSITIGPMQIGDANGLSSYTLAANGGSLAFSDVNPVILTQLPSSHGDVLATPITLVANLIVVNDSINPLTLAGPLSSSGGSLTIGSGVLQIGNGMLNGSLGSVNVTDSSALVFNCPGAITNSGVISGSGSLTNNGAGTVQLNAVETYTGPTVVNGGFLELNGPNSVPSVLNSSSGLIINNGGAVDILGNNSLTGAGATLGTLPITVNAGGTLTGSVVANGGAGTTTHIRCMLALNGGALANGGTGTGSSAFGSWALDDGLTTLGGTNTSVISALCVVPSESGGTVFNIAKGGTTNGVDLLVTGTFTNAASQNDTGIIKTGNGTMALAGVNTYIHNTFVNAGTLALTGSGNINKSAQVAVNNATFDMSALTVVSRTNAQFSLTNATVVLAVPVATTTNETVTTLNLGGTTNVINITSLPPITSYPQQYHLISYATLSGAFNIGLGSLPSTSKGYITNQNNFVDLVITTNNVISQLVWNGTDSSNPNHWDVGTSLNWKSNSVSAPYIQNDLVTFDDTATGQTNIDLMTLLTPGSLTVSNNTHIYNLGAGGLGGGRISGATGLIKQGSNLLILDEGNASGSYNDFSGGLTINAGTVQVGNGDRNGSLGSGPVSDNGALMFERSDNINNASVISGSGSLAQNGSGILTLSGADTYSGTTLIQNGTLQLNNNSALGPTNGGAVTITNGGTLDIGGPGYGNQNFVLGLKQINVSGWGVNSNGAIVNNGSTYQYANNNLVLINMQGDTAMGGSGPATPGNGNTPGRFDLRGTTAEPTVLSTGGRPYNWFKVGNNQIVFVNTLVDTNLANIDVRQGFLEVQGTTALGNPTNSLTVESGATFGMFQAANSLSKNFILNGNGQAYTIFCEGSANSIAGPITLNGGTCVFGCASGKNLSLSNSVGGVGSLLVSNVGGTTTLFLSGVNNTYTGNTMVMSGTLALTGASAISNSPTITVNSGASLDASQRSDTTLTLTAGQTLTGNGTLKGIVIVGSGATFAPGSSIGTMTFNNNLTLNPGSTTVIQINKSLSPSNSLAQVAGNVSYSGTLVLTNLGSAYAAGDSFKLFSAAGYAGAFTSISPIIPGLNLAWNTNTLANGILSIVSSPTARPTFGSFAMTGNNLTMNGSNGVPGWTYHVLTSTNLSLPVASWTIVATNSFDGSGNFNFTNSVGPGRPQQYFLLQLQ